MAFIAPRQPADKLIDSIDSMRALTRHGLFHDREVPSPENLNDEQRRQIDWINEAVRSGEIEMEAGDCLCGSHSFDLVSTYDRYRIWQPVVICTECGLVQNRPRMAPKTLEWFYGSDFYRQVYDGNKSLLPLSAETFHRMSEASRYRRDIVAQALDYPSIAKVAEVGCGGGWNLAAFRDDGKAVTGCDFSPGLIEAGRSFGLDLRQGGSEALGDEKFDLIVLSHVVEHFSDPVREVGRILDNLADNGTLYIEVPDIHAFCLGALQGAHLYYFTPNTLTYFMASIGLRRVSLNFHGGVFFSGLFVRDTPDTVDLSNEYASMVKIIRRHERREFAKSFLRRTGMFGVARSLINLYRRAR